MVSQKKYRLILKFTPALFETNLVFVYYKRMMTRVTKKFLKKGVFRVMFFCEKYTFRFFKWVNTILHMCMKHPVLTCKNISKLHTHTHIMSAFDLS